MFIVPPAVSEEQLGAMAQIFTGQPGGLPWSILGTTFEVAGVVRAEVEIDDDGINSGFRAEGVGQAKGYSLKNPVTGEDHQAAIVLDAGFFWSRGECGQGSSMCKRKASRSTSRTATGSTTSTGPTKADLLAADVLAAQARSPAP